MRAAVGLVCILVLVAMGSAKRYDTHDIVDIVAHTVRPLNNPTETYPYYSLPFCKGTEQQKQNLRETMPAPRKVTTPHDVTFLDPVPWRSLCVDYVEPQDLKSLKDAIEDHYIFEMFIDELPMWGVIGEVVHEDVALGGYIQGARVYLHTHLYFRIGYNGDKIVTANVTTDARYRKDITDVSAGQEVTFSYTVEWIDTPEVDYEYRMKRYDGSTFLSATLPIN